MKTKRISADEAMTKRKDQLRDHAAGHQIMVKAAKAPPSWDKDVRSARFVMSTQQTDRYGDIIVTEGIDTTEFERNPVGLLFHNSRDWPVARWENLEKQLRGRPPRLEGDFVLLPADAPAGLGETIAETEWMIANGGIRACSIGFVPDWDEIEMILDEEGKPTWGYRFNVCELVECSVCPVPANAGALVKSAGRDARLAKELLEDILDNWAKTPEGLLLPRADFEKAYRLTVEKIGAPAPKREESAAEADAAATPDSLAEHLDKLLAENEAAKVAGDPAVELLDVTAEAATSTIEGNAITADAVTRSAEAVETVTLTVEKDATAATGPKEPEPIKVRIDTAEFDAESTRVLGVLDKIAERITSIFGRKAAPERVEPKFEAPPLPAPEIIAAARESAAATLARLKAAGRI